MIVSETFSDVSLLTADDGDACPTGCGAGAIGFVPLRRTSNALCCTLPYQSALPCTVAPTARMRAAWVIGLCLAMLDLPA